MQSLFHLAFPIKNLQDTKKFYVDLLGCSTGRESTNWMDFNFFGHQLTAQINPEAVCSFPFVKRNNNTYPFCHFGAVLSWKDWHKLEAKLKEHEIDFLVEPKTVFKGEIGEQKTMFVEDPNGYGVEFKTFEQADNLFKTA